MRINEERIKTNLLMLDYFDMWDDFHYKSINDTKTMRYYNLISNLIDSQIDAGIRWIDSEEAEEYFKGESAYQTELFQNLDDEWEEILESKYPTIESLLNEIYRRGKAKGYADMQEHIKYTETDKLALTFAREYNFGLIQRLSDDTVHQIKNKIISGFLAGEHPNKIAPKILSIGEERLEGSTFSPRQRATMIARTEFSRVQNTGILQSYINEGYTEVKILTAEDNNVCNICLSYAFKFNKDDEITFENRGEEKTHNIIKLIKGGEFPPFHPLCRCTYLSVWKTKGEPPENPYVICLMPNAYGMKVPENLKDSFETVVNLTREELINNLSNVIDDFNELDLILDLLDKNFRNKVYNTSYEWGAGIGMEGECQKTYSNWIRNKILLSDILLGAAKSKGILTFIHSHPFTTSPLASCGDYKLFAEHKIKYGIISNEFGMMVIKNKNMKNNFESVREIRNISLNIEKSIRRDFNEHLSKKGINYKKLPKNEYNRKFQKYAKKNHYKYLNQYKSNLKDYFDITFINS